MKSKTGLKDVSFPAVMGMLLVAVVIIIASFFHLYPLEFYIGQLPFHHWMSITGASIVGVFLPVYSVLKRRRPGLMKTLFKAHIFLNLFAFWLITVHFSHHISEGLNPIIDTGTGELLYAVMVLLVATGIMRRFQILRSRMNVWRFLHGSLAVTFYLVVSRHILRALRIV